MRLRLALAFLLAGAAPAPVSIEHIVPIAIHPGVNHVERFAPDGRTATVVQGWHDTGNAYSRHVMMVLLPGPGGQLLVVPTEGMDGAAGETITDQPHTGDDAVRSVQLARAMVDGKPATLLLTATRQVDASKGITAASPVRFDVYRLVHDGEAVGSSPDSFRLLERGEPSGEFCNAAIALASRFKMASPKPASPGGC